MTGCVIVDVGVTNPNPAISTVAIAPFFNQSNEKSADGRRFASAYFTELQKVPGYQVVPVGVTETAIVKHQLKMSSPQDVLKLAEILNVDAVVVGSITDYEPYYPPRIGLHIEWYSPHPTIFEPGIQIDPNARKQIRESIKNEPSATKNERRKKNFISKIPLVLRGQSPENDIGSRRSFRSPQQIQLTGIIEETEEGLTRPALSLKPATNISSKNDSQLTAPLSPYWYGHTQADSAFNYRTNDVPVPPLKLPVLEPQQKIEEPKSPVEQVCDPEEPSQPQETNNPKFKLTDFIHKFSPSSLLSHDDDQQMEVIVNPGQPIMSVIPHAPLKPIMSYTRMFDGSDADLTATLRNYLELNGDARSGNWEATMQRSEDFIRFTCHLMIREMLTLHGGEGRRRIVFKHRKYK